MIHKVRIIESARKHGYTDEDIAYAWCNYEQDSKDYARVDPRSVHARVGHTRSGKPLELIAAWDERRREWQVFHAKKPGRKLVRFLGLE